MKVLVTGAAGFIGSSLTDRLLALGHTVTGVDNFEPYYPRAVKEANLARAREHARFTFREMDLRDREVVRDLLRDGFDVVAHIAARGGVRPSLDDPLLYQSLNVDATLNVLEGMRRAGIPKLVFASTSAVYGNAPKVPFSEEDSVDRPISPYAATKKACELMVHTFHHLFGLDAYCLRFFTVYGPRQRPDMAIAKFVRAAFDGKAILRYGDGSTARDYTFIDDILQGVVAAIERVHGYEIINLGESQTVTLTTLLSEIGRVTGRTLEIRDAPLQPGDVERTFADIGKARRLLDYAPTTPIGAGLERYMDWLRETGQA